jgi:bifunctional non-homologous end joining protein LigD
MHLISPREVAVRAAEVPVVYQIFDLLGFDGTDAMPLGYQDRRRLLADVINPGSTWSVPRHYVGGGRQLLDSVDRLGLEGIIAKRLDSRYEPGRRSRAWTKVKVRRHQEFVVGGWAQGEGRREGTLGSLLIGYYDESGDLRYAGRVGTGFSGAELDRLSALFAPLARETSPFTPLPPALHRRGAHWLEPEVVAEVAYGEWTGDGLLRHPAYIGQRTDKAAREVTRDL